MFVKLCQLCVYYYRGTLNSLCFKFANEDFQWNISTEIKQRHSGLDFCAIREEKTLAESQGSGWPTSRRVWNKHGAVGNAPGLLILAL